VEAVAVRVIIDVSPSSIGDNEVNSGFVGMRDIGGDVIDRGEFFR
jgi:hypothetical protein